MWQGELLFSRKPLIRLKPTRSDKEDIASVEVHLLSPCHFLELREGNFVSRERVKSEAMVTSPDVPVEKDAAAGDCLRG